MRRPSEPQAKLLNEARLADAGLADHERELPHACRRALPAPAQEVEFLLTPDERSEHAGSKRRAPLARTIRKERRRLRRAFQRMRAAILGDKQARDQPMNTTGDQHRPGFGQGLNTRGDIGRVAEDFSGRIHHHRAALDTDACGQLRAARIGVLAVEFGERALDGERSANRAFGIVLLRDRMSKQRHQPVAELLGHAPAHLRHRP